MGVLERLFQVYLLGSYSTLHSYILSLDNHSSEHSCHSLNMQSGRAYHFNHKHSSYIWGLYFLVSFTGPCKLSAQNWCPVPITPEIQGHIS